jgi:hypothetical protein
MNKQLMDFLIELGLAVNQRCRRSFDSSMKLEEVVKLSPADVIFRIDVEAEEEIVRLMNERAESFGGIILLAEGIGENDMSVYPQGSKLEDAQVKIICDPVDGSRGLMFSKRSAFFLAAAGPAVANNLSDLNVSVMVELPTPKQGQFDVLSATRGEGFSCQRYDRSGDSWPVELLPNQSDSVEGGFLSLAKFCYPGKDFIANVEEALLDELYGLNKSEFLPVFDDQYISSGGQLYELICGHDRFVGDFRASMYSLFRKQGRRSGQVCHPYDMAGVLIAEEAGVIVTSLKGTVFDAPLNTTAAVDWFGYSNASIRLEIEAKLQSILADKLTL